MALEVMPLSGLEAIQLNHRDLYQGHFCLYVNVLPDCLTSSDSILFADDPTIYGHNQNINHLLNPMTIELQTLMDWSNANKLSLNLIKTYYMLFSNSKIVPKATTRYKN